MGKEMNYFFDDYSGDIHSGTSQQDVNNVGMKNRIKKGLNYNYKMLLINRIGIKIYNKLNYQTKIIILKEESKKLKQEIIEEYGSIANYSLECIKKKGYINWYGYTKSLAIAQGFESEWEWRWDFISKKNGYKRPIEMLEKRAQKRDFLTYKDYEDYLAMNKGFQDRSEYRRFMHLKKKYPNLEVEEIRKIQLLKERKKSTPKA